MGYESRIYVVNRNRYEEDDVHGLTEVICAFNMGKIDGVLLDCFDKPFDNAMRLFGDEKPSSLYVGIGVDVIDKDLYGDVPKECDLVTFYTKLVECNIKQYYRRYDILISTLTPLVHGQNQWDEIVIVHTGY